MGTIPLLAGRGLSRRSLFARDSRLVAAAIHGDRVAFDDLVTLHEPELRRFVAKRIVAEHIDDVLQEVWIAAWAGLPNFDRRSQFKTWVYGICFHKLRDHYRSMKSTIAAVELNDQIAQADVVGVDVALVAAIPGMLAQLTETQREVLELYYFSQLNLPEIARALNRNLNTVKYQFYRAHSELAGMMKEDI